MRRRQFLLLCSLLAAFPAAGWAQVADPDPNRFTQDIQRFQQWDRQNAFPADGVLFAGSSSIVRWQTVERFPGLPVINRGFGGSHISDVNTFIDQTALRYDPALIVFYAGNNDIQSGKTPGQVLEDYQQFVRTVHAADPTTSILFISIHPSPARWARWPEMEETNRLVEEFSRSGATLHYVDISRPMLGADGQPIRRLYVEDGLHLTEAGYDVWTPIVARAIAEIRTAARSR
jgi:lysophospholipase L1-like esterase